MGSRAILEQMLDLLRSQVAAVANGDPQALLQGAARQEQLLAGLEQTDADPEELRPLLEAVTEQQAHLKSLLTVESHRVDFLLRLLIGGAEPNPAGYPETGRRPNADARMLNRRA